MKTDPHYRTSVSRPACIMLLAVLACLSGGNQCVSAQQVAAHQYGIQQVSQPKPKTQLPRVSLAADVSLTADAPGSGIAQPTAAQNGGAQADGAQADTAQANAVQARTLLLRVIDYLVKGPAFDAKFRQTVHASGREVVGVGTYEQAGGMTGRYHMQLTMLDGDGEHKLSQINDGVLAWTRSEISDEVSLRRVDVARLDEWVPAGHRFENLPPRLIVGGWAEMLTKISKDYDLRLDSAVLQDKPVAVIIADLKPELHQNILNQTGQSELPELYPVRIQLAIATQDHPEHQFGRLMPVRWEYRTAPESVDLADGSKRVTNGRLVTLIEMYSIRPIDPPGRDRFRFENHEAEVNFVNETQRYLDHYGVRLASESSPRQSTRR